ncbi:hypothetical protein ISS37_10555 [candidate division KSB1 bacterium]|nr:hypothetical protein [candidate division KSB1 bacterium]
MKKRPVNLERSDANIAEQYTNIYDGLQKDAAQNSWDARTTKKGNDWRLVFKYIHDRDILVIEDFGTTGMDLKKWVAYQSLWDTSKVDEETLGARGQGKFLFHYFSKDKVVLTETIDKNGNYRFSYGTAEEWDDETRKLQDFIPGASPLQHQGTGIWIMNIKPEFKDELLDYRSFMKYITSTWWEIIRNDSATFIVNFDGVDRQATLPDLPEVLKEKHLENERIKDIGQIRNLVLKYCKEDVPEGFRGIAIQRGGMTILRLQVGAEESIKNRVYGYCNFDDDLEMELKKCEMPNHFGFFNKKPWNHVREYVRKKLDDFLLEITPKKEKIKIEANILEEAVKLVNDLVSEYAPELLAGPPAKGGKGEEPKKPVEPREVLPVRIDLFRSNQYKFEYNETLIIDCEIANDTGDEKNLLFKLTIKHVGGSEKHKSRYTLSISAHTRKKIDIQLIDFDEKKDKAGEYTVEGILINEDTNEQLHKRKFTFYLHEEPPRKGKAFVAKFDFLLGKKTDGTLQYYAKWKNLPITEKGIIWVVYDHSEFVRLREIAGTKKGKKREILLYCARCGIDEAFRKLLELRYTDDTLDLDKIREIKNSCEEMLYEASLRTI